MRARDPKSLGDVSCLEPIAAAFAHAEASVKSDDWWRRSLREAFHAIVERHAITRRHAMMKKVAKRWPDASASLIA